MRKFASAVRLFLAAEDGPTAVEYAIMFDNDHHGLFYGSCQCRLADQ